MQFSKIYFFLIYFSKSLFCSEINYFVGVQLDSSILNEFEKKTKNKNFLFSNSVDFIYEVFNIDNKTKSNNFSTILKIIGSNKNLTNYFIKIADKGLNF